MIINKNIKFLNDGFARTSAGFMQYVCYFLMLFFIFGLVMSFVGRQQFILHTGGEIYEDAILAEEHHDWWNHGGSRGPTVTMSGDIRVWADDGVDTIARVGLAAMYAVTSIPLIISFWFLSRVFRNVSIGQIFTEQNAVYLLYYGLVRIGAAVLVPFLKLGIEGLVNQFSSNRMAISTGQDFFTTLIPNIAFLVAAYIVHYGVQLKDEVDHTL